jgi:hypothetical protein
LAAAVRLFCCKRAVMKLKGLFSRIPGSRRLRLNLLGAIILIAGLSSAASIWLEQDRIDRQKSARGDNSAEPLSPQDSRRYTHDVELYYGETGMLMEKWKAWFRNMTQRKPLAETIAVGSVGLAAGLFFLGTRHTPGRNNPQ